MEKNYNPRREVAWICHVGYTTSRRGVGTWCILLMGQGLGRSWTSTLAVIGKLLIDKNIKQTSTL